SCGKVGRCQRLFETPLQLSARGGLFLSPLRRGFFCFGDGRQIPEDVKKEKFAGRKTFLEKGSPSPRPSLPKTFAARPAGMSALVFRAKGLNPLLLSPAVRDARFHYRISKSWPPA
ncbi:hypothetical protein, partial [Desulfovibrio piger]|uniref:hypothetical protein n=1 Tax=Desulfovibrio piger TaxID=901 RepID=UPI0026F190C2